MTLEHRLQRRIRADGPLSIAEYMRMCLMHPSDGYYTTQDPFGASGDFVTAPEISQMFGELLGLCLAQGWLDQGKPAPFTLAECGPGRGTLMADILRVADGVPGFKENAEVHLIETSQRLRAIQKDRLEGYTVTFCAHAAELPDQTLFMVANEFFDALPIRQFQRGPTGWHERQVGLKGSEFVIGLAPETAPADLAHRLEDTQASDIVEVRTQSDEIISALTTRIAAHGGLGLIVDYGDWRSLGDTLQAMRGHQKVSVFDTPGQADLTAHVDFEALARASKCAHTRLTPQGVFLERLGITARAQVLAKNLTGRELHEHIAAHRRLTHPDEMGNLFKVLGLFPRGAAPPAGLEP